MYLTTDLPNRLRIETLTFDGKYITRVLCMDGCGACYIALEHDDEASALREHEICVDCALKRAYGATRHDAH